MRTLYDSIDVSRIPLNATMVAGYVGGRWPTYGQLASRFPHAVRVSIAINATEDAQVLDVETGDADPADAPGWAHRQRARGQDPTIYCNTATWPSVQAAFRLAGVPLAHWWRADYNGRPALEMGEIAHQYRSDSAQNLDYSVVADHWPGVDPPQAPSKEEQMQVTVAPDGTLYVAAANPAGHLLVFSKPPDTGPTGWSVMDITAELAQANPGSAPFTVQP